MGNYYSDLISKIETLISAGDYKEADVLLSEEMKMPYVPLQVASQLEKLKAIVDANLMKEKPTVLLNPQQVLEALRAGRENAYMALHTLSLANIRSYEEVISEYIDNPEADRLIVSMLLELLQQQRVNDLIYYYDQGIRKSVVPSELPSISQQEGIQKVSNRLYTLMANDNPSFFKQCIQVLASVAMMRYPTLISDDQTDSLSYSIIRYVFYAYGDQTGWENFQKHHNLKENMIEELYC